MKNLTILFGIIPICLMLSCKPTKVVTNIKEIVTHDTIRDVRIVERYKAVIDTLVIDNPCDSSGILSNFYSKIVIPQGKVIIRSYKGSIQATIDIDSIESVYETKYKSLVSKSDVNTQKFVRTNVIPSWAITTIFIETLIILLYLYFKFLNPFK
jgi:hypothetical protein